MKINPRLKTKQSPAAVAPNAEIDPLRARHMTLTARVIDTAQGAQSVTMDDGESPLVWLAKRRGRDGRPGPHRARCHKRVRDHGRLGGPERTRRLPAGEPLLARLLGGYRERCQGL